MHLTGPEWPLSVPIGSKVCVSKRWIDGPVTAAKYWPPREKRHSRHALTGKSCTCRMSSSSTLKKRSLSEKPTSTWWPLGWSESASGSSEKCLTCSHSLVV